MTKQIFCHGFAIRYRVFDGSFCFLTPLNILNIPKLLSFLSPLNGNIAFLKNNFIISTQREHSVFYLFGSIDVFVICLILTFGSIDKKYFLLYIFKIYMELL